MPQILISVPKRGFKLAVDRNKIKRRIKEAYRLQKSDWASQLSILPNCMSIIYVGKKIEDYSFIERKMSKALLKLSESLTTQPPATRLNKDNGDSSKESLI